ncbi:ribonuclease HII [Lachnospira pectinoschiza]|uniref:Ribonuclease HII n=1 Tax=Lachnospira pectinoschiza TaxID=28052 RepID=A0A1G9VJR4_9FIRM|nr:ribonuclease HII [Lachnospira pectinoschiza]MBQ2473296.1 ribonuclease HII [Lachnospira sp.]SDM72045.1 RNase HII [Lachnospira pectinoschiza]
MTLKEERELKKKKKMEEEMARVEAMFEYEKQHPDCEYIAGIDEVGRGPLAGPVVTCCIIMPKDVRIPYVNDSKKVTKKRREMLYDIIMEKAIAVSIGVNDEKRIDEINILQATYEAMRKAINNLEVKPDILLNDAVNIPEIDIPQVPIIKGDAKSFTIACASIIAKVTRDRMMEEYDKKYPGYGFAKNMGYGTKEHTDALRKLGPCEIHRRTFIKNFVD